MSRPAMLVMIAALTAAAAPPPHHPGRTRHAADAAPTGSPAQTPVGQVDTAARYAIAIDYNTGAVLLDKNASAPMTPSSMTKLMTAYVIYGLLKAGTLRLDQEFTVSERAWRTGGSASGGSTMFLPLDARVKVEDLIRGMIVQSGNDACIVLAEGVAGSEDKFVDLMNQKAHELGLTASNFRNSTGLPEPDHRMSARDIAELARRIIRDFPEYYHYDSEKSFTYNHITQENRNILVLKDRADGLKTGHTEEAGYGLVVSAKRGDRRVIVVVNGLTTKGERGEEGERLLDWAFDAFEDVTLFGAGDTIEQVPVWLGAAPTVPLVGGRDLVVTMPRTWRTKARIAVHYDGPVAAPVSRGAELGQLVVSGEGVPEVAVPLLAGADVPRLGLPGRAMAVLSHYVTGG